VKLLLDIDYICKTRAGLEKLTAMCKRVAICVLGLNWNVAVGQIDFMFSG
jgi:hypothetical protein